MSTFWRRMKRGKRKDVAPVVATESPFLGLYHSRKKRERRRKKQNEKRLRPRPISFQQALWQRSENDRAFS